MRTINRILLSLIFALPIISVVVLILYLLISNYDYFFPGILGPVLVLVEIILAPYGLALIFMNYRQLKKEGWKKTLYENVYKPTTQYVPAILGIGLLIYLWFYVSQHSIQLAMPELGANQFTFLMAFLLFVREALEVPHRFYMIEKAEEAPDHVGLEGLVRPRLSISQQKKWAVTQSVASLFVTWTGMLIVGFLLENLLKEWISLDSRILLYIISWIVWFVWIQRIELKLEKRYREDKYISWKAQYK